MANDAIIEAQDIISELQLHGEFVAQSAATLQNLKVAIQRLSQAAGLRLVFAPGTDPTLVDYLAIAVPRTIEGALVGTMVGLVAGALVDSPKQGAAIGAGIGAVVGAAQGINAVDRGWRVRANYLPDGSLYVSQF